MNKARRKELDGIIEKITTIRAELEMLKDEEQEYRDNMPENLEGSEKAEKAEQAVSDLESADDSLSDALHYIIEAQGG